MNKYIMLRKVWVAVFDENDDAVAAAKAAEEAATKAAEEAAEKAAAAAAKAAADKTFTQEQVNRMMAEDRRKHESQTKAALEELDAIKSKAQLSTKEREELEGRIDSMHNKMLTTDELAKKEAVKATKAHAKEIESLTTDVGTWKTRFTTSTIKTSITNAAVANDAFVPEQVVAILSPMTQITEALDEEGKLTGDLVPKVTYPDTDKDGKPITLELGVSEAVKRMTETDSYLNLFKGKGVGGVGGSNLGGGESTDAAELAKSDPAEYRKRRKDGTLTLT